MRRDQERAHAYLVAAFQQEKDGEDQLTAASIAMHLGTWFFAHDMVTEAGKYAKKAHEKAQQCLPPLADRKSTRLNSSHQIISYAVFCLKKKKHGEGAARIHTCGSAQFDLVPQTWSASVRCACRLSYLYCDRVSGQRQAVAVSEQTLNDD